jgi:hypothetical protein
MEPARLLEDNLAILGQIVRAALRPPSKISPSERRAWMPGCLGAGLCTATSSRSRRRDGGDGATTERPAR